MNWNIENKKSDFPEELEKKYGKIILELLSRRNIKTSKEIEDFFNFDYEKDITDSLGIPEIAKAVERIEEAGKKGEKIAIFGDYDADGVTASVILYETLTDLGFKNVISYIPDRQTEGYGMNEKALEFIKEQGVKLIITVDCGITNLAEVEKAKKLGMDVIITDHHHVPNILPKAVAIINPHIPELDFKFRDFAGVGVAYKLAQALYKKINPKRIDQLKWALDLVGIGTIADCVPLLGENRVLTKYGLLVLSKTRRVGIKEMFQVGRINISEDNVPDAWNVAFQISPRINAAGRMDHASTSYKLLIEKDRAVARTLALEVESKNQERQKVTGEIVREIKILADNAFKDRKIIFAANEHWPVGILGLVAGKIADEYKKPTIILQKQGEELTGSLRSIPEVDIMEVLEKCSEFLVKFGGHAQAAGITIKEKNAEKFFERFEKIVEEKIKDLDISTALEIDTEITPADINWDFMNWLKKMEPFGEGNRQPVFVIKNMKIFDLKMCGNGDKHWKISLGSASGSPKIFDSIGFGFGAKFPDLKQSDIIDVVCNLCEDNWNGSKKIQLKLIDLKKV
ncbi:MAG: single-stranded-DNA-specific exonuclease RecJ [Parcubacteria group bacterium]|jgi:single-stranded-DNA-specific exonuclease